MCSWSHIRSVCSAASTTRWWFRDGGLSYAFRGREERGQSVPRWTASASAGTYLGRAVRNRRSCSNDGSIRTTVDACSSLRTLLGLLALQRTLRVSCWGCVGRRTWAGRSVPASAVARRGAPAGTSASATSGPSSQQLTAYYTANSASPHCSTAPHRQQQSLLFSAARHADHRIAGPRRARGSFTRRARSLPRACRSSRRYTGTSYIEPYRVQL